MHGINHGAMPDLYFVEVADGEDAAAKIVKVVAERTPARLGLDPSATYRCSAR